MHKTYPATLTTGKEYTGNQQFSGCGIQRYCPVCACHRNQLGGTMRQYQGIKQWLCARHPKVTK